ncbi:pyrimidine-specific ribonucleoside hydrolase [Crossiella equi]|uniref:Pyrimidine-specific ribonucleoside hydrolase n=1 Tax=Crossiella equi TaxID=130796 RepID=A0ABS5A7L9_9PSEU|nr:nucleoside hydrolase [Crossiella equi]MBP2472224.1 pyrimidine-specific ribonucleoside hydrolase [Crossiella equi]
MLDVDTGIDDAMAILFAMKHPAVTVKAITCVAGNVSLDKVVANTLKLLDLADAPDIPVAAGADRPLISPARDASAIHGEDGIGGLALPASARGPVPGHAVELMRDLLLAAERPTTLVALAPMTNLALLLRTYPRVADKIDRIVFMGGSASVGNATAVAEFNVWHDPEAADIVLNSGIPLTMYGLDVFNTVAVTRPRIAELLASGNAVAQGLGVFLGHQVSAESEELGQDFGLIGDAGALCCLVAPELITFGRFPVEVDLAPGKGRGQTQVDRRPRHSLGPGVASGPLVDVALGADVPAVIELFLGTVLAQVPAGGR